MKKILTVTAILFCVVLTLCACGKKMTAEEKDSVYYEKDDFEQVKEVIEKQIDADYGKSVIDELYYMGDNYSIAFQYIADALGCDEVMVFNCTFHSKGVDYKLAEKNASSPWDSSETVPSGVYRNWRWVMIRKLGGEWKVGQCGPMD